MSAVENPFRFGRVATGNFFTDRRRELAELERDIHSGQSVVIISPRRYGKTSLVTEVVARLRRADVLVAYVDVLRAASKAELAERLASAIYADLVGPAERVRDWAARLLTGLPLQPKLLIGSDGSVTVEFTRGAPGDDVDRTFDALLELPERVADARGRRVAVILDEFQAIVDLDPRLPARLRSVFQFQKQVAHVFLGSRLHLMRRVFTEQGQPLYRLAKPVTLTPIPHADFAAFVAARFAATGIAIEAAAIDRLLDLTEGHPNDTQELAYFLWNLAASRRVAATPALVDEALAQVLDAEHARLVTLWETLAPGQRGVLAALAAEPGGAYAEEYRRRHGLGAASSVQTAIERLLEQDVIEPQPGGGHRVPDPFLRAWLRQRRAT